MKNIFVPYDFSEASRNAAEYAVNLAVFLNAKITLFHSFQLPVVSGEAAFVQIPYDELYAENLELLKKSRAKLQRGAGKEVPINCLVKTGLPANKILEESCESKSSLIVMGITGKNKLTEVFIGSNAIEVARNSSIPVLIVPEGVQYTRVKKIAFACDYKHTEDGHLLDEVMLFRYMFDAKLDIVNVYDEQQPATVEKASTGIAIENSLTKTEHHTYFIQNTNAAEGLNDYLEEHKPEMVIVVPKKHNLFDKITHPSVTKALAFHSHVPILSLHQN